MQKYTTEVIMPIRWHQVQIKGHFVGEGQLYVLTKLHFYAGSKSFQYTLYYYHVVPL